METPPTEPLTSPKPLSKKVILIAALSVAAIFVCISGLWMFSGEKDLDRSESLKGDAEREPFIDDSSTGALDDSALPSPSTNETVDEVIKPDTESDVESVDTITESDTEFESESESLPDSDALKSQSLLNTSHDSVVDEIVVESEIQGLPQKIILSRSSDALFGPEAIRMIFHVLQVSKISITSASAFLSRFMIGNVFSLEAYKAAITAKFPEATHSLVLYYAHAMVKLGISSRNWPFELLSRFPGEVVSEDFILIFGELGVGFNESDLGGFKRNNPEYKPITVVIQADKKNSDPNQQFLLYLKADDSDWCSFDANTRTNIPEEQVMKMKANYILYQRIK